MEQPRDLNTLPAQPASRKFPRYSRQRDDTSGYIDTLGVIPRRGWDDRTRGWINEVSRNPIAGIAQWAQANPLRLLHVLTDLHPMAAMASSIWLQLAFGPSETRFVAAGADGRADDEGTRAIQSVLYNLPPSIGGQQGLQLAIGRQVQWSGMACLEAVLAPGKMAGVQEFCTFDPLTVRFRYERASGRFFAEQAQAGPGWGLLDRELCLVVPYQGDSDNPYGRPLFGAALGELLQDCIRNGHLSDVLRSTAWPRLSVGFPFESLAKFAMDNPAVLIKQGPNGTDLSPSDYALQQFAKMEARLMEMKADDIFLYMVGGEVKSLNVAQGLSGIEPMIAHQQHRLCMALDTLPSLLGITSGGTQAYSTTQWAVQVQKLEAFRAFVNGVICRALNLHLKYLGMNLTARAEVKPIRPIDEMNAQHARSVQLVNEIRMVQLGFTTLSDACIRITGSPPVKEPEPGVMEAIIGGSSGGAEQTAQGESAGGADKSSSGDTPRYGSKE